MISVQNCAYVFSPTPQPHFKRNHTVTLASSETETLPGSSLVALPGCINAHTHLALISTRNYQYKNPVQLIEQMFALERTLTQEDVYHLSRLALLEVIQSGTTGVVDHYYFADAVAEACVSVGLRAWISDCALDLRGPKTSEDAFRKQWDFTEKWATRSPLIHPVVGPHAPDSLSDERAKELTQLATSRRLPLHFHLAQTRDELERMRARGHRSSVAWAEKMGWLGKQSLAAHSIYLDEEDLQLLAKSQTTVAFCPVSQSYFADVAPIERYLHAGIPVALGTDCHGSSDHMNLLREAETASFFLRTRHACFSAATDPLTWLTSSIPVWSGISPQGNGDWSFFDISILQERGYLVEDLDQALLAHGSQWRAQHVWVQGRFLLKDGNFVGIPEEDIRLQGEKTIASLRHRAEA